MSRARAVRAPAVATLLLGVLAAGGCGKGSDAAYESAARGMVVTWVGSGATREPVTVGITTTFVSQTPGPPALPLVVGLFGGAQRFLGERFTTAADVGRAVGLSRDLRERLRLEIRDPRYRVAQSRIDWVVRGTRVQVTDELCPFRGQRMGSAASLGATGIYLCAPLQPPAPQAVASKASAPKAKTPTAAAPRARASKGARPGTRPARTTAVTVPPPATPAAGASR